MEWGPFDVLADSEAIRHANEMKWRPTMLHIETPYSDEQPVTKTELKPNN